ncbi:UNVERIFIED_ORG: hypothetical protein GCAPEGMB_00479 [Vibrio phage V07]|nr:hypothetical protein KIT05_56 [Vibrio phage KIT05]
MFSLYDLVSVNNPKLKTFNQDGIVIGFGVSSNKKIRVKMFNGRTHTFKRENLTKTKVWRISHYL